MRSAQLSEPISQKLIEAILIKVYHQISLQQIVQKNLGKFSSRGVITIINELGDQLFNDPYTIESYIEDKYSDPLTSDNMMPAFLNQVEEKKSIPETVFQQRRVSNVGSRNSISRYTSIKSPKNGLTNPVRSSKERKKRSPSNKSSKNQYLFRNQQPEKQGAKYNDNDNDDQTIQVLREKIIEEEKKREQERKRLKIRQVKKEDYQFFYDYEGNLQKLNTKDKTNIVKWNLMGAPTNEFEKGERDNIRKTTYKRPTSLDVKPVNKEKPRRQPKELPKEPISFSHLTNLFERANLLQGVKVVHNRKTIQTKGKTMSVHEMKSSMNTRKVSKNQYEKIRDRDRERRFTQFDSRTAQTPANIELKHSQNVNYAMRKDSSGRRLKTDHTGGKDLTAKIVINNLNLRQTLIAKSTDHQRLLTENPSRHQQQIPELELSPDREQLRAVDQFNLLYMKKGANMDLPNSTKKNVQLPVVHKHSVIYPKGREKLKGAGAMIKELRKNFEEKLRR